MKSDGYWVPSNVEDIWREWLFPLKYSEISMVVSFWGGDFVRRVTQLIDRPSFVNNFFGVQKTSWKVLDYRKTKWFNLEELQDELKTLDRNELNIVLVYGFEEILRDQRRDLILQLQELSRLNNYRTILYCEKNYYDPVFQPFTVSLQTFHPKVIIFGKYDYRYLNEFVAYLRCKWNAQISSEVLENLVETVGCLWIIKYVTWYMHSKNSTNVDDALASYDVIWQIKSIWENLSEVDKDVLLADEYGLYKNPKYEITRTYLEQVGLLDIKVLRAYIRKYVGNPEEVSLKGEELIIGGKNISRYLTVKQKNILKELIHSSNIWVKREQMIAAVWSDDLENGSDWALDSQVKRLRQKLRDIGVGDKQLVTKRGKGMIWQS